MNKSPVAELEHKVERKQVEASGDVLSGWLVSCRTGMSESRPNQSK